MLEQWKDVVGYEEYFMISNYGNVWQKRTNKILAQRTSKTGYKVFQTRFTGKNVTCKYFRVHRMVAEAFINNPENKPFVNHIDAVKTHNHIDNLEWVTHKENVQHAVDNGLIVTYKGAKAKNAAFTEEQIKFIRQIYMPRCKVNGVKALAKKFNVHRSTISDIVTGKRYKGVK